MAPLTIDDIAARGARVFAKCQVWGCDAFRDIDLEAAARAVGGSAVLMNRAPPCRRPGCGGFVHFYVQHGTRIERQTTPAFDAWISARSLGGRMGPTPHDRRPVSGSRHG